MTGCTTVGLDEGAGGSFSGTAVEPAGRGDDSFTSITVPPGAPIAADVAWACAVDVAAGRPGAADDAAVAVYAGPWAAVPQTTTLGTESAASATLDRWRED